MDAGTIMALAIGLVGVVYLAWDALTRERRDDKDKR